MRTWDKRFFPSNFRSEFWPLKKTTISHRETKGPPICTVFWKYEPNRCTIGSRRLTSIFIFLRKSWFSHFTYLPLHPVRSGTAQFRLLLLPQHFSFGTYVLFSDPSFPRGGMAWSLKKIHLVSHGIKQCTLSCVSCILKSLVTPYFISFHLIYFD